MSFTCVPGPVLSPKRILYPTLSPNGVRSSSAMRWATLRAAMRLGCVCPMSPRTPRPSSRQILGNCVVLPEPVSPQTTTTWCFSTSSLMSSLSWETGSSGG